MNDNEQKRALDTWTKTMLTNAHKFDGLLDPTTKIVTHKKPVKKLDSGKENTLLLYKEKTELSTMQEVIITKNLVMTYHLTNIKDS